MKPRAEKPVDLVVEPGTFSRPMNTAVDAGVTGMLRSPPPAAPPVDTRSVWRRVYDFMRGIP